jgi:tetratricopeptide (TPR) repeat protein
MEIFKKDLMKILILSSIILFLTSCSSSRVISIKSTPQNAEVFVNEIGSGKREKIGETPLLMDEKLLKKVVNTGKAPVMIEVELPGYLKQTFVVNDLGKANIDYDIQFKTLNYSNIINKIDNVTTNLFKVQKLLRAGSYDSSLKILNELSKNYPSSSIINELMGSAYYLKKDYPNSLVYYDLATKFDQANVDAYRMKKYLEDELGVKRPLSKKVTK